MNPTERLHPSPERSDLSREKPHLSIGWFGPVDGRWMGLLDHFAWIEVLDRATATQWLQEPLSDRKLLVGLEHRSDERLGWLLEMASMPSVEGSKKKTVSKRASTAKSIRSPSPPTDWSRQVFMACVLGEDWVGHRRTFPLPDSIETFYWYQWYDQVIPWVCWEPISSTASSTVSSRGVRVQRIETDADRFLAWKAWQETQGLLRNRIAWVVSDQDSGVELWQGMLESYGIRAVGSRADALHGVFDADFVIVDCSVRLGLERCSSIDELVVHLRLRQPDAFFVVIDPFVGMDRWESYRALGVDAMVGRPFSLHGILCSWERSLRSDGLSAPAGK
jgi:hypothetical protein